MIEFIVLMVLLTIVCLACGLSFFWSLVVALIAYILFKRWMP